MDMMTKSKFEDRIIDLCENRDKIETTDIQGIASAIVAGIVRESQIHLLSAAKYVLNNAGLSVDSLSYRALNDAIAESEK